MAVRRFPSPFGAVTAPQPAGGARLVSHGSFGNLENMNTRAQEILRSALALPESDRAEIAASLIHSLDMETNENVDAAWAAEIQRRIESIDNGTVKLVPWDDVMREMGEREHD